MLTMKQFSGWVLVSYALLAIVASTVSALYDGRPGARILLEPDESKIVYIVTLEGKPVVAEYDDLYNDVDEASNKKLKIDPASVSRTASRRKDSKQYAAKLKSNQDAFLQKNLKSGSYEKVHSFTHVTNAMCVEFSNRAQVEKIKSLAGVVRVEKDYMLVSSTTHTPQLLALSSAFGGWALSGGQQSAGENIVIGMVDTGINPGHPSFLDEDPNSYGPVPASYLGTCTVDDTFPQGSCNRKLVGARYFSDSASAYGILDPVMDFASPMDGNGHGTHTSAIAAGNADIQVTVEGITFGSMSGVAPRARVATYKCIYRYGGFLSDCVAAIDQAVQDGVNVISMSLGPPSPPGGVTYLSSLEIALLAAVKAGVVVVQSAGNAGSSPGTVTSFSPWVISVGAANTDRTYPVYLDLGDGTTVQGVSYTSGLPSTALISSADIVDPNFNSSLVATDCQDSSAFDASQVSGKILICFYSDNFEMGATFEQVAWTAASLNASGFVVVASNPDLYFPIYFDAMPFALPGVVIKDLASSTTVIDYYSNNPGTAAAAIRVPAAGNAEFKTINPVVADYSSRGPAPSNGDTMETADVLKPDIIAPGSQIWSAWTEAGVDLPNWVSSFATLSGTSMAAPHVSGVVALLKQKFPSWSVAAIHSAIVTTATLTGSDGTAIKAQDDSKRLSAATNFDMGGGFLNPTAAFNPGLIFDIVHQDYINFICSVKGVTPSMVLSITGTACNTTSASKPSDLNTPSITIAKLQGTRNVVRKLTSVGSISETYTTTISVPSGTSLTATPTTFTIAPGASVSVKFAIKTTSVQKSFKFGRITWTGNQGHRVSIPVSVVPFSLT
ncbi:tRNA guanosine-2'-O-methyltransferase [Marchantia polymorpha subsp. ruderalis]|uniref:Subtilisin-like protease n=2 Tax=Marchantia polymorpha TaxID=3197 RepID=A0AAF6BR70_MARPO|nr:hypothetical protein MARPO_0135s0003 [Marchantia polymorpha]BBN14504.1 hypothetical protein Mp_6g12310 [Marchantia polymorpha subsp. ruderalis]|eukprot:PTQ29717.1 hypothetical protein MARPO_0135s0003 [Marchantia polymorpha]